MRRAINEKASASTTNVARGRGTLAAAAALFGQRLLWWARAPGESSRRRLAHRLLGGFIALSGAVVAAGGGWLLALGGSWYYALAGTALAVSGGLTFMGRPAGSWAYLVSLLGTVAWAVWEVGLL
jgi:hypothetical protein